MKNILALGEIIDNALIFSAFVFGLYFIYNNYLTLGLLSLIFFATLSASCALGKIVSMVQGMSHAITALLKE
jgi:hypothetical protein